MNAAAILINNRDRIGTPQKTRQANTMRAGERDPGEKLERAGAGAGEVCASSMNAVA